MPGPGGGRAGGRRPRYHRRAGSRRSALTRYRHRQRCPGLAPMVGANVPAAIGGRAWHTGRSSGDSSGYRGGAARTQADGCELELGRRRAGERDRGRGASRLRSGRRTFRGLWGTSSGSARAPGGRESRPYGAPLMILKAAAHRRPAWAEARLFRPKCEGAHIQDVSGGTRERCGGASGLEGGANG